MASNTVSEYEALRLRNIADNKAMLAKMLEDLKDFAPINHMDKQMKSSKKRKPKSTPKEPVQVRRNPARSSRYSQGLASPPNTRSRRGSLSSSASSNSSASRPGSPNRDTGKLIVRLGNFFKPRSLAEFSDDDEDLDEVEVKRRNQAKRSRIVKGVEDITEEDVQMVAEHVSDKTYDSVLGTSCHQCRQKTDDQKTICRSDECPGVRGQFCGPCLRNRYGENAREALQNPEWICPPCRGICNCSFCRRKSGKSCTGILIHLAREHGYEDVNSYLKSFKK